MDFVKWIPLHVSLLLFNEFNYMLSLYTSKLRGFQNCYNISKDLSRHTCWNAAKDSSTMCKQYTHFNPRMKQ